MDCGDAGEDQLEASSFPPAYSIVTSGGAPFWDYTPKKREGFSRQQTVVCGGFVQAIGNTWGMGTEEG